MSAGDLFSAPIQGTLHRSSAWDWAWRHGIGTSWGAQNKPSRFQSASFQLHHNFQLFGPCGSFICIQTSDDSGIQGDLWYVWMLMTKQDWKRPSFEHRALRCLDDSFCARPCSGSAASRGHPHPLRLGPQTSVGSWALSWVTPWWLHGPSCQLQLSGSSINNSLEDLPNLALSSFINSGTCSTSCGCELSWFIHWETPASSTFLNSPGHPCHNMPPCHVLVRHIRAHE